MSSVEKIIEMLKTKAKPDQLDGMARFGIVTEQRLGLSVPEMRKIAKEIGKDHQVALGLWETGILEARIVAGMIAEPDQLTEEQMEAWVVGINSWDVCDQVCMNLFEKSAFAQKKIFEWSQRPEEFVKRAAFALIACLAWHDKEASDEAFIQFLPLIQREATDDRNFVKKAVNWSLRNIGKRNLNLNKAAIAAAKEIQKIDDKTARWIASNAIKELESEKIQERLHKKAAV
jgi:3-methyladenine DNA glycosylase AlkD